VFFRKLGWRFTDFKTTVFKTGPRTRSGLGFFCCSFLFRLASFGGPSAMSFLPSARLAQLMNSLWHDSLRTFLADCAKKIRKRLLWAPKGLAFPIPFWAELHAPIRLKNYPRLISFTNAGFGEILRFLRVGLFFSVSKHAFREYTVFWLGMDLTRNQHGRTDGKAYRGTAPTQLFAIAMRKPSKTKRRVMVCRQDSPSKSGNECPGQWFWFRCR